MTKLTDLKCIPCRGNTPTLSADEIKTFLTGIPEWKLIEIEDIQCIERSFSFKNFSDAVEFTNRLGVIAESEGHHPRIVTEWGSVVVQWWTYAINGLHKNDFIMAAKTNLL